MIIETLLMLAVTTAPSDSPATTQDASLRQLKQIESAPILNQFASMPKLAGEHSLIDVVRISLDGRRLVAETKLEPMEEAKSVKLTDSPALASVIVMPLPVDPEAPPIIRFEMYDLQTPDAIFAHAWVGTLTTETRVAGAWQLGENAIRTVEVQDQLPPQEPIERLPPKVTVYARETNEAGELIVKYQVTAADLPTLMLEHRREVNAYVRPVFRMLKQESVLAVDEGLAWQVLGAAWTPDEQARTRVQSVLDKLDAETFREREAAAEELRKLGTQGAIVLMQIDRSKLSAEQNARIDEVLADYRSVPDEQAAALRDDLGFLIDVMISDNPDLRRLALEQARRLNARIEFDIDAPAEARFQSADELRRQFLPPPATQPVE